LGLFNSLPESPKPPEDAAAGNVSAAPANELLSGDNLEIGIAVDGQLKAEEKTTAYPEKPVAEQSKSRIPDCPCLST
jgi:hypothetical protein